MDWIETFFQIFKLIFIVWTMVICSIMTYKLFIGED